MAHSGRFSERIAARSPGCSPRPFRPSESARTVKPKSPAGIDFHTPLTLETRRPGFPLDAAMEKMSHSVRGSMAMVRPPDRILSRPPGPVKDRGRRRHRRSQGVIGSARMAIALLAGTLLALAGFLLTSVQGFALTAHLAAVHPEARFLVTRHVVYAIPTVLFSLFSQSMVI